MLKCCKMGRYWKVREAYGALYVINIVSQAIFTLLWNIGLALLVGWIAVSKLGAPDWTYVPLIIIGVLTGLFAMVKFILAAMRSLDRLEAENRAKIKLQKRNGNSKKNGN